MRRPFWAIVAVFWMAVPALGDPEALFSERDDIESRLIQLIQQTTQSIDAAIYDISSPALWRALREAAERGVLVRVVSDRRQQQGRSLMNDRFLPFLHIRWIHGRTPGGAMHHKFAVFDGLTVVTGSYNWTSGARHVNFENVLVQDDRTLAATFDRQFERLWTRSRSQAITRTRKPHERPRHRTHHF